MKKLYSIYIFALAFFLLGYAGNAVAALPIPSIGVNPDIYYPFDEILYIEGGAKPNSTVQIRFQKGGAKPIKVVTKSDLKGEWVFAEKVPLEAGNWEVRARIVEGGATSDWSNPRIIKAISTGIIVGGITIKFTFLMTLLIISAGLIFYLFFRMKKEAREKTEAFIEQDFSNPRRDIAEELKHLGRKRSLSQEEQDHRDKLLRDLEHVEKEINRKLRNF